MNYQKQYANKINWQNTPSISTPLNATNLNKMDNALWYMDDALYVLSNVIAGGSSARGGIITNVGHNIFTTHIDLRSGENLSTGELLFLRSNVSGSGNGINVYIDESMAVGFGFVDLSGTATSVTLTSSSVLLLMLDAEENTAQVLSVLGEGGGGGGGSYSAGSGINITNNVITNTRKGALPGVIDEITSGGYAHTQINDALNSVIAGSLVVLKSEVSGSASNVQIQYGAQASQSQTYRLCDTDLEYTTINVSVGDTIILMFDPTGYKLVVLSVLSNSGGGGDAYAGLGVGKMVSFTSNVVDTDIDLHRAPMAGDRLLIWFDTAVQDPTGLTTYNNGTAVTSNLENVIPLYYNAGWNIVEYINDGLLYNNVWVRIKNVPIPNNTLSGLNDTAISANPTDGQVLTFNSTTGKWGNQTPSGVAESVVGTVENNSTASKAYAVGEHFIRNDKFCTAIAAIASGATLTLNTNYVEGTIAEAITYKDNYSTTEQIIGKWIDGSPIYRKVISFGTLPNRTSKFVDANMGVNIKLTKIYGIAISSGGSDLIPLPYLNPSTSWTAALQYRTIADNLYPDKIHISTGENFSVYTESYVIMEYIKV